MTPSDRERWNARHASAGVAHDAPSAWLVEHAGLLAENVPGCALDVACGRGGNALALAALGFEVDALDVSDVAIAAVQQQARARGLAVTAARVDLADAAGFPRPAYDLIVDVDFLDRRLLPRLAGALAPGGLLVFEGFTEDHGRMNPAYTLRAGELDAALAGLGTVRRAEADGRLRIVARRGA